MGCLSDPPSCPTTETNTDRCQIVIKPLARKRLSDRECRSQWHGSVAPQHQETAFAIPSTIVIGGLSFGQCGMASASRWKTVNLREHHTAAGNAQALIIVKMNESLDVVAVINQANVASDRDIAVVAWRGRQAPGQIGRSGMHISAHFIVEDGAFLHTGFLIS